MDFAPNLPYNQKPEELFSTLETDPEEGLSSTEASKRLEKDGKNVLPEAKKVSPLELFLKQFASFMIYILLGAIGLSLFLRDYKDAILIGIVVIVNAIIGFYQEYKAEKTLASLKKMASPTAKVLRDGQIDEIATAKLVKGDIVILEEGDLIPADVRLFESVGLSINESILTGESVPSQKDADDLIENKVAVGDQLNMAFMGTIIASGNGRGVVTATGAITQIGRIAATLAIPYEKPTPLQKNLNTLGKYLVIAAISISIVIFIIGLFQGRDIKELLFTVISLAVAVIPEGLVAVVTVTMAIGVQHMARRNAIVRSLPAVETLGAVNVICSDKTGTLTEGKMVATDLWVGEKLFTVSGTGVSPEGSIYVDDEPVTELSADLTMALTILSLCNDSVLQRSEGDSWEAVGDPTEISLQVLSHKLGVEKENLEEKWEFIEGLPFDSDRKRMSVLHRNPEKEIIVLTKGAPEEIIDACTKVREQGEVVELTPAKRKHFRQINVDMAERGLRVLGIAYRPLAQLNEDIEPESVEQDMILVGMVGVLDPARPEAKKAVEECKKAGIEVMMITGDHPATAVNIATGLGFFNPSRDKVMTGEELDSLSEDQLIALTPFPKVFARVSPENKLILINALRKMKYVVAMTGDGVNDAAAIKHANVGVAMGKEGTDVTRQAADIVLSDDNFATIVSAVEEGRRIFTNIRKFIRYLLSCNMSSVLAILFATIAGIPLPFTPIQILWLNLVTDTPPALALGFDQLEKNAMEKPPRDTKKGVFRQADIFFIIYHGAVMAILMLAVFLVEVYLNQTSIEKARTMAFAMLVLVQLTQAFNARSTALSLFRKNIFSNKSLIAGLGTSFVLLLVGMYFPFLSGVFEQVSLGLSDWLKLAMGVILFIIAAELFKLTRRKFFPDSLNI